LKALSQLKVGASTLDRIAALGLSRLLGYLLYRVSPRDPSTFAIAL
jgi:hypothetical protein